MYCVSFGCELSECVCVRMIETEISAVFSAIVCPKRFDTTANRGENVLEEYVFFLVFVCCCCLIHGGGVGGGRYLLSLMLRVSVCTHKVSPDCLLSSYNN